MHERVGLKRLNHPFPLSRAAPEPVHEHNRNAVTLDLVVELAARHPQDRHNAIVLRARLDSRSVSDII